MIRMKRALFLALALAAVACAASAGDCVSCTAAKLCDAHAAADKEALKALREGLSNPDPAVRKGAIELFGEACAAHGNCRPPANAAALAAALKDPDSAVRALAAERMGAQDSKTAGQVFAREMDPLVKMLDKEPRGAKEEAAWVANYEYLGGIAKALAAMGNEDAGPATARMLGSTRLKVLNTAADTAPSVRSKLVPPAMIEAIDRVRFSKPGAERDATWVRLLKGWEAMTHAGTKSPNPSDPADAVRFVEDCKAWWKVNEKSWK